MDATQKGMNGRSCAKFCNLFKEGDLLSIAKFIIQSFNFYNYKGLDSFRSLILLCHNKVDSLQGFLPRLIRNGKNEI